MARSLRQRAYGSFAFNNTTAVPCSTSNAAAIQSTVITRSSPCGIEAAICPSPNSPLPVFPNSEVLCLTALKLEASRRWSRPGLSDYPRVYGFGTKIFDYQRHIGVAPNDVCHWRTLHVMEAIRSRDEA